MHAPLLGHVDLCLLECRTTLTVTESHPSSSPYHHTFPTGVRGSAHIPSPLGQTRTARSSAATTHPPRPSWPKRTNSVSSNMNRRAGATDRHALLAAGAYPTSSSLSAYRSSSPYDSNPYPSTSSNGSSYPSSSSNPSDFIGAPKKEPPSTSSSFYSDGTFGRAASNYTATRTAEDLEEQNEQRLDGLTARVSMLKEITLNIGTEVTGSTKDLASLGEAFENTSAFLGGTFKRMNKMAKRQGGWFCNMMLFLLFVTWLFVSVITLQSIGLPSNLLLTFLHPSYPIHCHVTGLLMVVETITPALASLAYFSACILINNLYLYLCNLTNSLNLPTRSSRTQHAIRTQHNRQPCTHPSERTGIRTMRHLNKE